MLWADKPIKHIGLYRCTLVWLCIQSISIRAEIVRVALWRRAVRTGFRHIGEAMIGKEMSAIAGAGRLQYGSLGSIQQA